MSGQTQLQELGSSCRKIAVLGAGSVLCGDDAAGMLVVELLQAGAGENEALLALPGSTAPENFTGVLRDYQPDLLLLVDAAFMEGELGEIRFLDAADIKGINFSTHMLPLSVLVDYLRQETAAQVAVIGIQPGAMDFDSEPSEEIRRSCQELAAAILALFA